MSQIQINNLTFRYDSHQENIFHNITISIDTDWKLGLIGRNGRGKTTLLKLLCGELEYSGEITSQVSFDYFPATVVNEEDCVMNVIKNLVAPFSLWEKQMEMYIQDEARYEDYDHVLSLYIQNDGYIIEDKIKKELALLDLGCELLDRKYNTLSGGEKTKVMLVGLFLKQNNFLLIDEPTNHLDLHGRQTLGKYLNQKKGFIVVSHDKSFLDSIVDHVMSLNKEKIIIEKGNFETWNINREREDEFERQQNEKLKKSIDRLKKAAREREDWSNKREGEKMGNHIVDRGFCGARSARLMKRSKSIEKRYENEVEEKSKLLKNIERQTKLLLTPVNNNSKNILFVKDLTISYDSTPLFKPLSFQVDVGERVFLRGRNGCGKTSLIKLIVGLDISYSGTVDVTKSISYVSQTTSHLTGYLTDYIEKENLDATNVMTNLYKLGFQRIQFEKKIDEWSEGQKKKLLVAKSLSESAQLYIWDEPLNFIDIISRKQIENLILEVKPTMIIVEHDSAFAMAIATKFIDIERH